MHATSADWTIEYYTDPRGISDVLEYINALQATERAQVANALRWLKQFGVGLGMPHARELRGHKPLWELRPGANRVIYFAHTGRRFIMLHAFRKQSRKTPQKDITIAEKRMFSFLERERDDCQHPFR
jgi:phage-related protein